MRVLSLRLQVSLKELQVVTLDALVKHLEHLVVAQGQGQFAHFYVLVEEGDLIGKRHVVQDCRGQKGRLFGQGGSLGFEGAQSGLGGDRVALHLKHKVLILHLLSRLRVVSFNIGLSFLVILLINFGQ